MDEELSKLKVDQIIHLLLPKHFLCFEIIKLTQNINIYIDFAFVENWHNKYAQNRR